MHAAGRIYRRVQQSSITINRRMHKWKNVEELIYASITCFHLYTWIHIVVNIYFCMCTNGMDTESEMDWKGHWYTHILRRVWWLWVSWAWKEEVCRDQQGDTANTTLYLLSLKNKHLRHFMYSVHGHIKLTYILLCHLSSLLQILVVSYNNTEYQTMRKYHNNKWTYRPVASVTNQIIYSRINLDIHM